MRDPRRLMGAVHEHEIDVDEDVVTWLWGIVGAIAVVVLVAAVALWPGDTASGDDPLLLDADPMAADVVADDVVGCSYDPAQECRQVSFVMTDGPYAGENGAIEVALDSPIRAGDDVLLTVFETESGRLVFDFYDFQRGRPLAVLAILFAGAVIALGRWRGLGALAGLVVSFLVIVYFMMPAILAGSDAMTVAIVAASVIAFAAMLLAHGFGPATAVALLSTLASLLLTAVLASLAVGATRLTGLTDDSTLLLAGIADGIDARGVVLAGIVIGALGVLDDVTVTQVSAVWELKAARPESTAGELIRPSMRIGRDHISSTVNTLFLAYAGTALPLLLLFTEANQSVGSVMTREIVAAEVVRTLVGSIGLVASVPISTWLAALVVSRRAPSDASAVAETAD